VGSHAALLQSAGADNSLVDAVAANQIDKAKLSPKERALLDFVEVLTRTPWETRDSHVQRLRLHGWSDEEIFEAAFDTALFAFFNRMADAYGLDYPDYGWKPKQAAGK